VLELAVVLAVCQVRRGVVEEASVRARGQACRAAQDARDLSVPLDDLLPQVLSAGVNQAEVHCQHCVHSVLRDASAARRPARLWVDPR